MGQWDRPIFKVIVKQTVFEYVMQNPDKVLSIPHRPNHGDLEDFTVRIP